MFVGRINEINQIQETIKVGGNHVLLYGNRRVGKSTLAFKAVKIHLYLLLVLNV